MTTRHDGSGMDFEGSEAHLAYRSLILARPEITHFGICRYKTPPPLQERITLTTEEEEIVQKALERREDGVTPFWHAVFATCLSSGLCTDSLLDGALFHNGCEVKSYPVSRLQESTLDQFFGSEERNVGLSSRLDLEGGRVAHLALLDFRCDVSPENTRLLGIVCSHLFGGGFMLIDSGDSYHACGLRLLSSRERVTFLARSVQLAPIVDTVYVGHQLQQSFSSIRLSCGGSRNRTPRVVRVYADSEFRTEGPFHAVQ